MTALWATAQYTFRHYVAGDAANEMGSAFADTAASGLAQLHELAVDAIWRPPGEAGKSWRVAVGGFYRDYNVRTPYIDASHDGRGGGRGGVQYWITRELHLDVAAEVAQSSLLLARDLGTVTAVRAAAEVRW